MRQCPKCNSQYSDDTLNYCLLDGTALSVLIESDKPTIDFSEVETIEADRGRNIIPVRFRDSSGGGERSSPSMEIFESELDLTKIPFSGSDHIFICAYPKRFKASPALKITAFRADGSKEELECIKVVEQSRGTLRFKVLRQTGVVTEVDRDADGVSRGIWIKPTGWGVVRIRIIASGECEPGKNPEINKLAEELDETVGEWQ